MSDTPSPSNNTILIIGAILIATVVIQVILVKAVWT